MGGIVFVGAYAYAKAVLEALPEDPDLILSEFQPDAPRWQDLTHVRGPVASPGDVAWVLQNVVAERKPDLVIVAGWRKLVPIIAPTVGFHSAKLPEFPGRAPVAHALLRGDRTLTNTMLWLDDGVDTGDIIDEWVHDIRGKTPDRIYEDIGRSSAAMLRTHWRRLLDGTAPRRPQDMALRGPETSKDGWARLQVPPWVEAFG